MTIFENVNLYELSRTAGTLRDTGVTSLWSNEPTGVSFNAANQHLFVSDDTGTRAIYEVDPVDSRYGNGDVTPVSEPVGLAVNPDDGIRYLVEESGGKMVGLTPAGDLVGVIELTGLSDPLLVTHADGVVQLLTPAGLLAIDLDVPSSASVIGRPAVTTPVGMTHNPTSDETLILESAGPRIVGVRPDGSSKVTVLTELAGRAVLGIAHNPVSGLNATPSGSADPNGSVGISVAWSSSSSTRGCWMKARWRAIPTRTSSCARWG